MTKENLFGYRFGPYANSPITDSTSIYVATDGNDSNSGLSWGSALATIPAALSLLPANGGIIELGYGTFNVSSSGRSDASVSYSAGTWTDASITNNDVGSYVLGTNINNKVPKIATVNAGVSFTTDIAPVGSVTNQTVFIVNPAFVLPAGVMIRGRGGRFTSTGFGTGDSSTSKILDSGTGITCLIRGGQNVAQSRFHLQDLAIWSSGNNTFTGLYIGNFAWFVTAESCDFTSHGTAGVILDGNMNSHNFKNCMFSYNGKVGAATVTGGVLTSYYWNQPSASIQFDNCFFDANFGWGINSGQGGGAFAVKLTNCQFNNQQASAAALSGVSAYLATTANGNSSIEGGWSESAATTDLYSTGPILITAFRFWSSTAYGWFNIGGDAATVTSSWFANHSTASVNLSGGGNINWIGVHVADPFFCSGLPGNTAMKGMGSTAPVGASGAGVNFGSFGSSSASGSFWVGSGAPNNANGGNGDGYWNTAGAANTTLYQKRSGIWTAIL